MGRRIEQSTRRLAGPADLRFQQRAFGCVLVSRHAGSRRHGARTRQSGAQQQYDRCVCIDGARRRGQHQPITGDRREIEAGHCKCTSADGRWRRVELAELVLSRLRFASCREWRFGAARSRAIGCTTSDAIQGGRGNRARTGVRRLCHHSASLLHISLRLHSTLPSTPLHSTPPLAHSFLLSPPASHSIAALAPLPHSHGTAPPRTHNQSLRCARICACLWP